MKLEGEGGEFFDFVDIENTKMALQKQLPKVLLKCIGMWNGKFSILKLL